MLASVLPDHWQFAGGWQKRPLSNGEKPSSLPQPVVCCSWNVDPRFQE